MRADFAEQFVAGTVDRAWPAVEARVEFLRAPLGLQAEPPGLYPEHRVAEWAGGRAGFAWRTVEDVNHYTISLGATGATAVVAALDELIR